MAIVGLPWANCPYLPFPPHTPRHPPPAPIWNKPRYMFYEGLPKREKHPEDIWVVEQEHIHESSEDLPGSLLQQDTDQMTGKIYQKLSACRCFARVGYWGARNSGEHER